MAWNKSLNEAQYKAANGPVGLGAPVALNPSLVGRPYRDGWDIERAYREGVAKVTWVFRCIDVIAGNQARLPVMLRKGNSIRGEIVENGQSPILELLNTASNVGENSFVFRYRLSSQMLMSTRGVFVEVVRGRGGDVIALHLLPPQLTSPIPDPVKFVAGYEVRLPGGLTRTLSPESVIWLRRPHPLDPYLSLTPMEAAGIAIEIENLAKVYNRNYLLNDGRPGSLIVVRGEIDDADKEELRSRFRGNLNKTGQTTVLSADDGVDFIDTSASPRDAAYGQMREITKVEILAAFGVPETIISQAGGRTFSNASEEVRVFWMETMKPHLEQIGRGLDVLDPKYYIDFDTSEVPIFLIMKQERANFLREEFANGLISGNEYRIGVGRSKIESELMDSMLVNPNLTPIGNTEKPFEPPQQPGMPGMPGVPGQPAPADMTAMPPGPEIPAPESLPMPPSSSLIDGGAPMATPPMAPPPGPPEAGVPIPGATAQASLSGISSKHLETQTLDEWDIKAETDTERWTKILERSLERLFERQQRVISEKAGGAKVRRALENGSEINIDQIFDIATWDKQMEEDIRPVLTAIVTDAADLVGVKAEQQVNSITDQNVQDYLNAQMERMQKANETTKEEIIAALLVAQAMRGDNEDSHTFLKAALAAIFAALLGKRLAAISGHEAQTAYNAGTFFAGAQTEDALKTWITRRDTRVRPAHQALAGRTVPLEEGFVSGNSVLRFPGDPLAPPELTINCRCRLRYNKRNAETL